ncbi:hypothetical protein ONZ45_g970 [Pleurotus djamor]|nr:hypothetical protein ONZ45_g970 [Pleurotus djamor]
MNPLELKWLAQHAAHDAAILKGLVKRRMAGEPLQYILGTQPFGPLNLLVRPPVLIPRPETEHWVMHLSTLLSPSSNRPLSLLDLGTGSGCIPLLLCHIWPKGSLRAHGVDISPHAVRLASENAQRCAVPESQSPRILANSFKPELASYLSPQFTSRIKPPFDIITSNPPYIPLHEYNDLPKEVKSWEDRDALYGGQDGLDFYRAIARLVSQKGLLSNDGLVVLEVGHDQADSVQQIMQTTGNMSKTETWIDPWGKRRTVVARP